MIDVYNGIFIVYSFMYACYLIHQGSRCVQLHLPTSRKTTSVPRANSIPSTSTGVRDAIMGLKLKENMIEEFRARQPPKGPSPQR